MTDAELIERLREHREYTEVSAGILSFEVDVCIEAADRIEALLNLNEALVELMDDRDAKLAKAVEGLEKIAGAADIEWTTARCGGFCNIARATLAEIKGESHE